MHFERFSGRQLADIFLFLCLVACEKNVIRAQRSVRRHDDAHRTVNAREFLDRRDVFHIAHARAAVLGRKNHPQQAQLAELLDDCERELAGLVPLHDVGLDLALGELANALFQMQLLVV